MSGCKVSDTLLKNYLDYSQVYDELPEVDLSILPPMVLYGPIHNGAYEPGSLSTITVDHRNPGRASSKKHQWVFVGSSGNYLKMFNAHMFWNHKPCSFEDCTFIIEEGADLGWLAGTFFGLIQMKSCKFVRSNSLGLRRYLGKEEKGSFSGYSAGGRMLLLMAEAGLLSHLRAIIGMPFCRLGGVDWEHFNLRINSPDGQIQTNKTMLLGYLFIRGFLEKHGLEKQVQWSSPLHEIDPAWFTNMYQLPQVEIPDYPLL